MENAFTAYYVHFGKLPPETEGLVKGEPYYIEMDRWRAFLHERINLHDAYEIENGKLVDYWKMPYHICFPPFLRL